MEKAGKKIIFAALVITGVIVGLVWFIFFFQIPKISGMAEAIQKEKLDSFVRQEKGDKIFKLKKELADIEDRKEDMEDSFITKDQAVPFFRSIEKAAADASCRIEVQPADLSKVKFSAAKPTAGESTDDEEDATKKKAGGSAGQSSETAKAEEIAKFKAYPAFNIEVTGTFASVMDFLKKMENIPYFARILVLDLAPAGKKETQAPGAATGTIAATGQMPEGGGQAQEKTVKLGLLIIVYTNEQK